MYTNGLGQVIDCAKMASGEKKNKRITRNTVPIYNFAKDKYIQDFQLFPEFI